MKSYPEIVHSLKDKHILVTGGAGFIGSTITEALLNLGASVTVLDNLSTGLQSNVYRLSHHEKYRFIKGDICQPEDFTYVQNVVLANLLGLTTNNQAAFGSVFNVACGKRLTLNEVISGIVSGVQSHNYQPTHSLEFGPNRIGDIPHTLTSIAHIQKELNYFVLYTFEEGLATYLAHSLHD